ncbi:MAG TPA: hypothetical protein VIU61_24020, partial [Kofleriaceae bacterium]
GPAADDIWAVGESGRLRHWNGSEWASATGPTPSSATFFATVTATTDGFLAAGSDGALWRMTGGEAKRAYTTLTSAPHSDLYVASETNAFAIAGDLVLRYNGTEWRATLPPKPIRSLSGTSGSDVWGVGGDGAILHFDGMVWSAVTSPTTEHLVRVLALAADDAWAVGAKSTIVHWDGVAWRTVEAPPASTTYNDLWAATPTDIWAVGTNGVIARWNGISWTQLVTNLFSVDFQTVWGSGPENVWIPLGDGTALRWTGVLSSGHRAPIATNHLWGTSAGNIYAVTSHGTGISHFDGSGWTMQDTLNIQPLYRLGGAGNRVWAVGAGGAILSR